MHGPAAGAHLLDPVMVDIGVLHLGESVFFSGAANGGFYALLKTTTKSHVPVILSAQFSPEAFARAVEWVDWAARQLNAGGPLPGAQYGIVPLGGKIAARVSWGDVSTDLSRHALGAALVAFQGFSGADDILLPPFMTATKTFPHVDLIIAAVTFGLFIQHVFAAMPPASLYELAHKCVHERLVGATLYSFKPVSAQGLIRAQRLQEAAAEEEERENRDRKRKAAAAAAAADEGGAVEGGAGAATGQKASKKTKKK